MKCDTVSNFTVGISENGSATSKRFWSYCDIGALSSKEDKRPEMLTSVKRRGYYGRFFHFHSSLKGGQNVMICHSQSKVGHTTIIYWLQYSTMYNYSRTVGTYRDLGTGPWTFFSPAVNMLTLLQSGEDYSHPIYLSPVFFFCNSK